MYANVLSEMENIIKEKWTNGMAVAYGTTDKKNIAFCGVYDNHEQFQMDSNTFFDLASVTKIFTLVTILKLYEEGKINLLNCIGDYSELNDFINIQHLRLIDLMNFSVDLVTSKRIDQCSCREIEDILHNIKIRNSEAVYSDMGAILLSFIVDHILGKNYFRQYSKDLWKRIGMTNTYWWDEIPPGKFVNVQSYDNEYRLDNSGELKKYSIKLGQVHDPKSRVLKAAGHAGIFSTVKDMSVFCEQLLQYKVLKKETIDNYLCSPRWDVYKKNGQHFGLLCYKRAKELKDSEIPNHASDDSIAMSGYTGTYILLDFKKRKYVFIGSNRVHNRITNSTVNCTDEHGKIIVGTRDYVYRKDKLRDICFGE